MASQTENEHEIAELLVSALDLEDLSADDIDPEAPLFDVNLPDSLGLDSIDALEISLALAKTYQVQLKADDEANHAIFSNLRSLTQYVFSQR